MSFTEGLSQEFVTIRDTTTAPAYSPPIVALSFWTKAVRVGHWSLVIGHWSLVIGHWSLVIGHWLLVLLPSSYFRVLSCSSVAKIGLFPWLLIHGRMKKATLLRAWLWSLSHVGVNVANSFIERWRSVRIGSGSLPRAPLAVVLHCPTFASASHHETRWGSALAAR